MRLEAALHAVAERRYRGIALAGVTEDTRRLEAGMVFVARRGHRVDGHDFLPEARARGAAFTVGEHDTDVVVDDSASALADLVSAWYGDPGSHLTLIGITGTNGKSTVAHLLASVLGAAGQSVGLIGTTGYTFGPATEPATHTTPPPEKLYPLLRKWADAGASHVVMEVSAQALAQRRAASLRFAASALTSFSREHGEAFPSPAAYRSAKATLFRKLTAGVAVLPHDEPTFAVFARAASGLDLLTFGRGGDMQGTSDPDPALGPSAVALRWEGHWIRFPFRLPGRHNLRNAMCAAAIGVGLGLGPETIEAGLRAATAVPGRGIVLRTVEGATVIVDYAHNPAALKAVLGMARAAVRGRLHVVLGPRGERDPGKRPLMGMVLAAIADSAILTSDRPASEDPSEAARSMLGAARTCGLDAVFIADRERAIAEGASRLGPGDCLVITGKGLEAWGADDSVGPMASDLEALAGHVRLRAWSGAAEAVASADA